MEPFELFSNQLMKSGYPSARVVKYLSLQYTDSMNTLTGRACVIFQTFLDSTLEECDWKYIDELKRYPSTNRRCLEIIRLFVHPDERWLTETGRLTRVEVDVALVRFSPYTLSWLSRELQSRSISDIEGDTWMFD